MFIKSIIRLFFLKKIVELYNKYYNIIILNLHKEVEKMVEKIEDIKIKKTLDFYMLINNLKYTKINKNQTITEQLYGTMVLANAINSEYNIVNDKDMGTVLKKILLDTIYDYNSRYIIEDINNPANNELGAYNLFKLCQYCNPDEYGYETSEFAFRCSYLECIFNNFFEVFLKELEVESLNLDNIYDIAKKYRIISYLGNDEKKNYEIFRFYYLNRVLKKKERKVWDETHWNIKKSKRETIASHIIGTITLALFMSSELDININIDEVITMLSIHELGEIEIGDTTPFDGISPEVKRIQEHKAFIKILGNLTKNKEMLELFDNFEDKKTEEAQFAYYCDKLEADIQAKVYYDLGLHHPLEKQENNIVMKSKKVQEMIANGATNAFDIWYKYDKPIYQDNEVFSKTLKYVRDNKLK